MPNITEMLYLKKQLINFGWFNFKTLEFQAKNNKVASDLLEYELNKDCAGYEEMRAILN